VLCNLLYFWNSRTAKFTSFIMKTCCCWTSSHAGRGNEIVKVISLIMNTCTFLCVLFFLGQWPLVVFVDLSLLNWQQEWSCFYSSVNVTEKIGIFKSVWEHPRIVLLILMGLLLGYLQFMDKRERKKGCAK
jgi:hypothetical protein